MLKQVITAVIPHIDLHMKRLIILIDPHTTTGTIHMMRKGEEVIHILKDGILIEIPIEAGMDTKFYFI